ncbi:hypothetical protein A1OE_605 [Candidatus Endolissoclinum faulkneri L2]|uniref:Uncharacterized protein n=1 Tax=Candidatus Endolissoclinum faulkneri L2 TaxID=1193729 RepID=K7YGU7_9PROT|nr:hypothetical protein A1OE_605 [Candidatus Endolissoclinum faulkneri L2]
MRYNQHSIHCADILLKERYSGNSKELWSKNYLTTIVILKICI